MREKLTEIKLKISHICTCNRKENLNCQPQEQVPREHSRRVNKAFLGLYNKKVILKYNSLIFQI